MTPLYAAAIRYAEAVRAQAAETHWPRFLEADRRRDDALQALNAAALAHPTPALAPGVIDASTEGAIDTPGGSDSQIGEDH